MVRGGDQAESVSNHGTWKGFVKNAEGVGFSLEPASRNARFPVHVYLNGATANPVVVESSAWEGDTEFNSLRVDVGPGGGQVGDQWRLWIRPTVSDQEKPRLRTDEEGFLATRHAGRRELFVLDSRLHVDAFAALIGKTGGFYIRPDSPTTFTQNSRGEPWDVSGFGRVLFAVEQLSQTGSETDPLWSFVPFVEAMADTGSMSFVRFLTMGTVGEFGKFPATPWDGQQGSLLLGADAADAGPSFRDTPAFLPLLRFGVTIANNEVDGNLLFHPGFHLRLVAVAY